MGIGAGVVCVWIAYQGGRFLLNAREMQLIHPEQVELSGNHFVPRATVLEIFAADRGRSILRLPINQRRRQLESVAWIERATVRRALPNRIQIEIIERTPVAFLRQGSDMMLIDSHGVVLERPLRADFHFPVATGISMDMPQDDREKRMQLFASFSQQVEDARPGAMEKISEVDLSDASDLIATIDGLQSTPARDQSSTPSDAPVTVHFGDTDFGGKYSTLIDDIGQWRATTGQIESIDLRFSREAVVNPETPAVAQSSPQAAPQPAPLPAKPAAKQHAATPQTGSSHAKRKDVRHAR